MAEEGMIYFLIAIIAIVAIVGLVVIFIATATKTMPAISEENIVGAVTTSMTSCNTWCNLYCAASEAGNEKAENFWARIMHAGGCVSLGYGCNCEGSSGRIVPLT